MLAWVVPLAGSNVTPKTSIVAAPTGQENAQADMANIQLTSRIDTVLKLNIATDSLDNRDLTLFSRFCMGCVYFEFS